MDERIKFNLQYKYPESCILCGCFAAMSYDEHKISVYHSTSAPFPSPSHRENYGIFQIKFIHLNCGKII